MKPKILMLGWEFPPLISGGLGVACKGIADSLSKKVNLTVLVPKIEKNNKFKYKLVGIYNEINKIKDKIQKNNPFNLPKTFSSYYNDSHNEILLKSNEQNKKYDNNYKIFDINNLYGNDLFYRMENYSEFAVNYIKKKSFDIIHAHDWLTIGTGLNLKNILKKPLVMHIHSLETDRNGEESRGHIYELEKQGMKSADLIIAVSHYTKNKIIDHYKINPEKIEVAHNGNNFRKTSFTKTNKSTVTVGFIGRLTQQKGPDIFLKIAEKVLDKNKNIQFIVTGVGEKLEKLIKQTSENYMGDKIHFTGFINPTTMKKLMKKIDLYCMPSVSEPFGLTAVEATSCNIPCLISKQSGVKEVLKNSITFDFWDINKAAGIILNLAESITLQNEITRNAITDISNINWTNTSDKILKHYYNHRLIK